MWRFLLPAFAMTTALIVLFAGALGDLHSWPNRSEKATIIGGGAPGSAPLPRPAAPPAAPTPAAPAAAVAELQAARDALRRTVADLQRQADELQQQVAQRSHVAEQSSRDLDAARAETDKLRQGIETLQKRRKAEEDAAARQRQEQQMAAASAPPAAAVAQQQAARDALQRQIADLQRQSGELQQQVAQRSQDLEQSSHDLDAARSESRKLRQDIAALEQFRKTAEQQIGASARPATTSGPSPGYNRRYRMGVRLPICSNRSRNARVIWIWLAPKPPSCGKTSTR